jgi:2'-hydroxyisoflavone reductase
MQTLILGGTEFLGRHIAREAIDRGHEVTLFNRGVTAPDLFTGEARLVVGDRDGGLDALGGRSFDLCIDTSGYVPRLVADSARALAERVGHYTFVSSISVYPEFTPGIDEQSRLADLSDPTTEVVDNETYGGLKVLCERAAAGILEPRDKLLNVRPGLIVGPYDPSDRFTYWCLRAKQGGAMVAPVGRSIPVQVIDARDLGSWILDCGERSLTGTFNATGRQTSLGKLLDAIQTVTGCDLQPVWMSERFLLDQNVTPWVDLPIWLPQAANAMMQVSVDAALAEGLKTRPLTQTVEDLLTTHHGDREKLKAGLQQDRENDLLAEWAKVS